MILFHGRAPESNEPIGGGRKMTRCPQPSKSKGLTHLHPRGEIIRRR